MTRAAHIVRRGARLIVLATAAGLVAAWACDLSDSLAGIRASLHRIDKREDDRARRPWAYGGVPGGGNPYYFGGDGGAGGGGIRY